jgi:hypothetical protein
MPAAVLAGGEMRMLVEADPAREWELRLALLGRTPRAGRPAMPAGRGRIPTGRRAAVSSLN